MEEKVVFLVGGQYVDPNGNPAEGPEDQQVATTGGQPDQAFVSNQADRDVLDPPDEPKPGEADIITTARPETKKPTK